MTDTQLSRLMWIPCLTILNCSSSLVTTRRSRSGWRTRSSQRPITHRLR